MVIVVLVGIKPDLVRIFERNDCTDQQTNNILDSFSMGGPIFDFFKDI